jgi:predicted O-methyltransferase YrrM
MPVLDRLLAERPTLHGGGDTAGTVDWGLDGPVLEWLASTVRPGWTTLETGCGYSTIVLADCGAEHVVLSPSGDEHETIRRWCAGAGVDLGSVRFVVATSQDGLPALPAAELDLVLIDGDHAFPYPVLDFFHGGRLLRDGGLLVIDDVQLPGPRLVADFCRTEELAGRWRAVTRLGRTEVFAKGFAGDFAFLPWRLQPWSVEPGVPETALARVRALAGRLARR